MESSRTCLMVLLHDLAVDDAYKEKFMGIANAFIDEGYVVTIIGFWGSRIVALTPAELQPYSAPRKYMTDTLSKLVGRLKIFWRVESFLRENRVDVVFIRYPVLDPFGFGIIYRSKALASPGHIIYEVPTVVAGSVEVSDSTPIFRRVLFRASDCLKRFALKYVDTVAGVSYEGEYLGYQITTVENGVVPKLALFKKREPIDTVVKMMFALRPDAENIRHGLDRMLKGIADYEKKDKDIAVELHVVGMTLDQAPRDFGDVGWLKQVKFYGERSREFIAQLSKEMHVGVGQLGFHRIGLTHGSALKEREYLANALPIVTSCTDNLFPEPVPFRLNFPQNDDPIDIVEVVSWAVNFYGDSRHLQEMLVYLKDQAGWDHAYKHVLKSLGGKNGS